MQTTKHCLTSHDYRTNSRSKLWPPSHPWNGWGDGEKKSTMQNSLLAQLCESKSVLVSVLFIFCSLTWWDWAGHAARTELKSQSALGQRLWSRVSRVEKKIDGFTHDRLYCDRTYFVTLYHFCERIDARFSYCMLIELPVPANFAMCFTG